MLESPNHGTKLGVGVSVPVSSGGTGSNRLPHISSEITSLALEAPDPPGSYWLSPSQHRRRAAQLRAQDPNSRAATLAELAARVIKRRLRNGNRR
jgi:hypothetical protein